MAGDYRARLIALAFCILVIVGRGAEAGTVVIDEGRIAGVSTPNSDVLAYKRIPYAAPPIGSLVKTRTILRPVATRSIAINVPSITT